MKEKEQLKRHRANEEKTRERKKNVKRNCFHLDFGIREKSHDDQKWRHVEIGRVGVGKGWGSGGGGRRERELFNEDSLQDYSNSVIFKSVP